METPAKTLEIYSLSNGTVRFTDALKAMQEYAEYYHLQKMKQAGDGVSLICQHCGKYKTLQGNGMLHQLCECATPVPPTDAQIEGEAKAYSDNTKPVTATTFLFKECLRIIKQNSAPTEAGRGEGGWKVVKEQGPPFDEWVLVWCKIYGRYIGRFERIENSNFGQWNDGKQSGVLPPIYWQHLPKNPTQ